MNGSSLRIIEWGQVPHFNIKNNSHLRDTDGNLTRHTRPDGSFIDYAWNARNLLASVISDAPPPVASYTYNGRNQIASTVVENGLFTASRSYDGAGRLTGVTNGALDSTGYTLSADGRRTGINRNGDAESYSYDNARQVTSATYGGGQGNTYTYDAAGNRTAATTSGGGLHPPSQTYTANSVNEYTAIAGLVTNPAYDTNGNATTWNVNPRGTTSLVASTFTWNIHNELITATNANGDSASYQYDALGRRTKRVESVGGAVTTTWFFTNAWNVELEHDGSDFAYRHTWGLDLSNTPQGAGGVGGLVMTETLPSGGGAPVPHFPTYDGNGNITAWVNDSGTVVARQRYDAYGNIIQQTGAAPSNYGFSTKPQDQVTGLLYYGYRYYDPVTGRWPSRDPIGEGGGVNLFGFVRNNPLSFIDLLGMSPIGKVGGVIAGELPGMIAGVLESSSKNNIKVSGNSVTSNGKRGEINQGLPACSVQRGTHLVVKIKGVDSWVFTYANVDVELYFKHNGCDVVYLGVQVSDESFYNGLWGSLEVVGTPLGDEDPVDGNCYCCEKAACVEYKVAIKGDLPWYGLGHNDYWMSTKFKACGDGSITQTEIKQSDNIKSGWSDFKNVTRK